MARASSSQTTSERATMSTSSPDYGSDRDFDVFLNFRGPDSRYTVVDVLYKALIRAGITVFYDDESIRKGEVIEGELLSAITNSKIYITIFSKDYASSRWCLRELAKMMECLRNSSSDETNKVILPVFCDVDVGQDLKLRSQVYTSALEKHRIEQDGAVVKSWELALKDVAKIKGWNLRIHGLDELKKLIVDEVCGKLSIRSEAKVPDDFVGIHKPIEDIMKLLDQGTSGVRFVVIHGMGGIGKTTLARRVFNQISYQFQERCFLSDVHESSCTAGGIKNLQQKLLHEILGHSSLRIDDACDGANMIKQRLRNKKVLIVLDNLNNVEQLEKLAGSYSWFGRGSRIIITTRNIDYLVDDEEGLDNDKGYEFYKMELMKYDDALKLFSRLAFKIDSPPLDYYDISRKMVDRTGRLPLAIRVIGLLLRNKGKKTWDAKLKKMEKVVHKDVRETLAISFEDLDNDEKENFLDIACLFINKEKTYAMYYWEAQKLFPNNGINVLKNMSLVEIVDGDKLWMHDLLRDLGRSIVDNEDKNSLGRRSRLWLPKKALKVLHKKKGTEAIVALKLGILDASCSFTHEQFAKLTNLRFLELNGGNFANGEFNEVFSELIWLTWDNCPLKINNLSFKNLVVLKLSGSQVTEDWSGWGPIMFVLTSRREEEELQIGEIRSGEDSPKGGRACKRRKTEG